VKIGRNEKCPCNSGKKYKHCCGNVAGTGRTTEALRPATYRSLLFGKPAALALLDQVQNFYGDRFTIRENQLGRMESSYELMTRLFPEPLFESAAVILSMTSGRRAAALTHELLHLRLPIIGYPLMVGLMRDRTWNADRPLSHAEKTVSHIFNMLHHELFLPDFLSFGFAGAEFVSGRTEDDIIQSAEKAETMVGNPDVAQCVRGLWNGYYLNEFISDHLGPPTDRSKIVQARGRTFLSTMDTDAENMRQWVLAGRFKAAGTFNREVNRILLDIGLPRVIFGCLDLTEGPIRLVVLEHTDDNPETASNAGESAR
jgi:hypothetical protein